LMRLDQASMAASLESRVPFTDHRLVEAFWNIPAEWNISPLTATTDRPRESKKILRVLAGRHLPEALANRPKASFPTPVPAWLSADWADWSRQLLTSNRLLNELFRSETLKMLADQPAQAGMWAWPLLNLAIWADSHYQG